MMIDHVQKGKPRSTKRRWSTTTPICPSSFMDLRVISSSGSKSLNRAVSSPRRTKGALQYWPSSTRSWTRMSPPLISTCRSLLTSPRTSILMLQKHEKVDIWMDAYILSMCVCVEIIARMSLRWLGLTCHATDVTVVLLACYICMRLCLLILDSCPLYVLDLAEASSVSFSPYWCEIILTRKRAFTSIISCLTIFNWRIVKLNTSPASCWP